MTADAAEDGLRVAVERLAERWADVLRECKAADPKWLLDKGVMALGTAHRELTRVLAEHQPTAREAECGATIAASEFLPGSWRNHEHFCSEVRDHGLDDTEHRCRCGAAWTHSQPAPVAPAGEVRLTEAERQHLADWVLGGSSPSPLMTSAVERILAARLAAAEQRVTEAKAEALQEAADVGLAEAHGAGAIDNDAARWLRARAADIRREATGEGGDDLGPQNAASATETGLSRPKGSQRGNYATGIPNGPENAKNEGDA